MDGSNAIFPTTTDTWIEIDGRKYTVSPGQSALEAMLAGGANVTFSCRKGTCRSCMLEAVSGDPGEEAQSRLPADLRAQNFFLPCTATDPTRVVARLPDLSKSMIAAELREKTLLGGNIWKIVLEPETVIDWRAGQFISLRRSDCRMRSYSIVSRPEDYFIELHIRHYPDGEVSNWLVKELQPGDRVRFSSPSGTCYYSAALADRPLWFISNGSGAGAMAGIARDALERGHTAPIRYFHGAHSPEGHYLSAELDALAARYPNFTHAEAVCGRGGSGLIDAVIGRDADLAGRAVFLCGSPDMVEEGRIAALRQGAALDHLYSDPFEGPLPIEPRDSRKIAATEPFPELWEALDNGRLLNEILTDFYTRVFENPRLAPFFRKVTKDRLIQKQYSFLQDLLTGQRLYFGELPFNAHHWMIISDELFDYREELFFSVVREHGVPEHLLPRWLAIHEMFRREIVKSSMRGQWFQGKEVIKPQFEDEMMIIDSLCDGCQSEIKAGETVRHHVRTGEVYCSACAGGDLLHAAE